MKKETLLKLFGAVAAGTLAYLFLDSKEKNNKINNLEKLLDEKDGLLSKHQEFIGNILTRIKKIQEPSFKQDDLSHIGQANVLLEAVSTFGYGFYRSSTIMSGAVIESVLQEQFDQQLCFYSLINKAREQDLINDKDVHALHTIRKERNNVHDITQKISERDALITLNIAISILEKLVELRKQKLLV